MEVACVEGWSWSWRLFLRKAGKLGLDQHESESEVELRLAISSGSDDDFSDLHRELNDIVDNAFDIVAMGHDENYMAMD